MPKDSKSLHLNLSTSEESSNNTEHSSDDVIFSSTDKSKETEKSADSKSSESRTFSQKDLTKKNNIIIADKNESIGSFNKSELKKMKNKSEKKKEKNDDEVGKVFDEEPSSAIKQNNDYLERVMEDKDKEKESSMVEEVVSLDSKGNIISSSKNSKIVVGNSEESGKNKNEKIIDDADLQKSKEKSSDSILTKKSGSHTDTKEKSSESSADVHSTNSVSSNSQSSTSTNSKDTDTSCTHGKSKCEQCNFNREDTDKKNGAKDEITNKSKLENFKETLENSSKKSLHKLENDSKVEKTTDSLLLLSNKGSWEKVTKHNKTTQVEEDGKSKSTPELKRQKKPSANAQIINDDKKAPLAAGLIGKPENTNIIIDSAQADVKNIPHWQPGAEEIEYNVLPVPKDSYIAKLRQKNLVLCEGYVGKRRFFFSCFFHKRYFLLTKDSKLIYFRDPMIKVKENMNLDSNNDLDTTEPNRINLSDINERTTDIESAKVSWFKKARSLSLDTSLDLQRIFVSGSKWPYRLLMRHMDFDDELAFETEAERKFWLKRINYVCGLEDNMD